MPTIRFSRPFASGCKPTPDPYDHYLDTHGFYRKHTARDSSSLFRVISEQLYDTQDFHHQIRKDCVNFMIKHRDQYESMIQGDFDKYVRTMAKSETCGTLTELRALGFLFKRNIKLYRPFEQGCMFVHDPAYEEKTLNVFYTTHFDSIFEKSYIVDAAFCQSIVYETLYKNVFKLPDIEYSVETMLHTSEGHEPSWHEYENGDSYATHIVFEDGRKFQLDRPEKTLCILSNPERCHFHNKNFEEILENESKYLEKSILPDKYCSCVRQLLNDGITPFPYKVAKALDENIYRNVEFDSWNDMRKSKRMKAANYKAGVECLVQLKEMNDALLKCYMLSKGATDDTCVVFIEKFGEKRSVPYTSLRPLNVAERVPTAATQQRDKHMQSAYQNTHSIDKKAVRDVASRSSKNDLNFDYDAICNSLNFNSYINLSKCDFAQTNHQELIAYPIYTQTNNMNSAGNRPGPKANKNLNQNSQNAANVPSCESNDKQPQQLPKIDGDQTYGRNIHDLKSDVQQTPGQTTYYPHPVQEQNVDAGAPVIQQQQHYQQPTTPVYYCQSSEYGEQNVYQPDMVMPHGVYTIPAHAYQTPPMQQNMYTAPVAAGWPGYSPINPQGYVIPPPQYAMPTIPMGPIPFQLPFLRSDLIQSNGRINFNPSYAYAPSGDDLPLNDKVSTRFYYNLGVEYFKLLQQVYGTGQLMAMIDGEPVGNNYDQQNPEVDGQSNQLVSDLQQLNFEQNELEVPPSPTKQQRNYNDFGYGRRGSGAKYNKRNDNRSNAQKHFQGSFAGPSSKQYPKNNNPKYMNNQSGNNSYDSTPIKEMNHKSHHQGHAGSKRDQSNPDGDSGNGGYNGNAPFIPPFPYNYDVTEQQYYGHPGNVYRMTPPVGRPMAVATVPAPYHHPVQGNYWVPPPQQQQQQQGQHQLQQQQSQSHSSLNTSGASNPSQ